MQKFLTHCTIERMTSNKLYSIHHSNLLFYSVTSSFEPLRMNHSIHRSPPCQYPETLSNFTLDYIKSWSNSNQPKHQLLHHQLTNTLTPSQTFQHTFMKMLHPQTSQKTWFGQLWGVSQPTWYPYIQTSYCAWFLFIFNTTSTPVIQLLSKPTKSQQKLIWFH